MMEAKIRYRSLTPIDDVKPGPTNLFRFGWREFPRRDRVALCSGEKSLPHGRGSDRSREQPANLAAP
jgi:hypothetical protein